MSISQEEESSPQSPCTKTLRAAALFSLSFFIRRHCDQRRISSWKRFCYQARCGWQEVKKKSNWKGCLQHSSRLMLLLVYLICLPQMMFQPCMFVWLTLGVKSIEELLGICSILAITLSALGKKPPTGFFTHLHQGKWEIRWIVWKEVLLMLINAGQTRPLLCTVWWNCGSEMISTMKGVHCGGGLIKQKCSNYELGFLVYLGIFKIIYSVGNR